MNGSGMIVTLLLSLGAGYVAGRMIEGQMRRNPKPKWPLKDTVLVGQIIGINWDAVRFTPSDLARGIVVELEHGLIDPRTNVTDDDIAMTAKIAWAHLNEFPDYYQRLDLMEDEAEEHWRE